MNLYRVTGRRQVLGFDPDTEFHADLDPIQEERLIGAGHLVLLTDSAGREPYQAPEPAEDVVDERQADDEQLEELPS